MSSELDFSAWGKGGGCKSLFAKDRAPRMGAKSLRNSSTYRLDRCSPDLERDSKEDKLELLCFPPELFGDRSASKIRDNDIRPAA